MSFCFVDLVFSGLSPCFFLYCALRFFLCSSGLIVYGIFGSTSFDRAEICLADYLQKWQNREALIEPVTTVVHLFLETKTRMHGRVKGGAVRTMLLRAALLSFLLIFDSTTDGMLYPRETESRQLQELNGMWNFRADTSATRDVGMKQKWFDKPLAKVG